MCGPWLLVATGDHSYGFTHSGSLYAADDRLSEKTLWLHPLRECFLHTDHPHARKRRILLTAGRAVGYHSDIITEKRLLTAVAMIDGYLGELLAQTMIDIIDGKTLSVLQGTAGRKNILHAFPLSDLYV